MRGITFSAFSIQKIKARAKIMTRRVVTIPKWSPDCLKESYQTPVFVQCDDKGHSGPGWYVYEEDYPDEGSVFVGCPYTVGQRLYVREAARLRSIGPRGDEFSLHYLADDGLRSFRRPGPIPMKPYAPFSMTRTTPPRFMPRWAARMVLEVTDVRIERLMAMSAADAVREGMDAHCDPDRPSAVDQFKRGWDEINPKSPWASDPFVWVVSFTWLKGAKVCT
jgi:hypothetical protein